VRVPAGEVRPEQVRPGWGDLQHPAPVVEQDRRRVPQPGHRPREIGVLHHRIGQERLRLLPLPPDLVGDVPGDEVAHQRHSRLISARRRGTAGLLQPTRPD
jgi:hypothetical protein